MNTDLHFYGTAVLARAGGFNETEALTIAYAAQYVDDATEGEPIPVGDIIFEPVRTAQFGLDAYNWSVQKRIFIPFHFIPPRPLRRTTDTFVTEPGSAFAKMVWADACLEPDPGMRLVRMGIALHTYADTWSHKWFSGRRHPENDVEAIHLFQDQRWKHLKLENFYLDLVPQVGHAAAGAYPDMPQMRWRYRRKRGKRLSERNNTEDFLKAFKNMHRLLCAVEKIDAGPIIPWEDLEVPVRTLFEDDTEDEKSRCRAWMKAFAGLFTGQPFAYDKLNWRCEALKPANWEDVAWDSLSRRAFRRLQFEFHDGFYDSNWVRFHRAALQQRHFVLERLI